MADENSRDQLTDQPADPFVDRADATDVDDRHERERRQTQSNVATKAIDAPHINFYTRKWVRPEDLNANGSLFGGSLLKWIDEEAAIYAILQLGNERVVTKYISEIDFVNSAREGDLIELGIAATHFGRTSLTMACEVRNMITRETIISISKIVFVNVDEHGRPTPHGYTEVSYLRDRVPKRAR